MKGKSKHIFIFLIMLLGCIEPINLENRKSDRTLVVEGYISNLFKQHQISISTSTPLNQKLFFPEEGAEVWIQEGSGARIQLNEESPGIYKTILYAGKPGTSYKLFINTKNGEKYSSDEVLLRGGTTIEKVSTNYLYDEKLAAQGFQITLDTQDPENKTKYYRWEYEETYEIKTPYPSNFEWVGGNVVRHRIVPVNVCWASDTSKNILIHTTEGQAADKVTAFPIKFVREDSYAMNIKYSILIRQLALNEASYFMWKNLKEVNETQGSLSDLQPGTVEGNIHSLDSKNKAALGYFDAVGEDEKRIFLTDNDFKDQGFIPPKYLPQCIDRETYKVPVTEIGAFMETYKSELEIYEASGVNPATMHLLPKACCNCTDLGTNIKPVFWE